MIRKYRYGNPLNTEAVVTKISLEQGSLPYVKVDEVKGLQFTYELGERDRIYGLGEAVRGINKRGWIYVTKCSDDPVHSEDKQSLYGAHNFLMIDGKERFGIFIDYPGFITYDLGYQKKNQIQIHMEEANADIYIIDGEKLKDIVHEFRKMIGQSYIPPKWAFGYGQSRWSYMDEQEIREVANQYEALQLPLDSIYMDIDYMERYKDFTLNEEAFPNFPEFVSEMKERGIRLVPIIDAGVKVEDGYDVYEEGVENHYFCEKEDGSEFRAGVWPGIVHFPDFLNPNARHWFGMKYKRLMDAGIEGFWNDMNEPAIFYSEDQLKEVFEKLSKYQNPDMGVNEFWSFKDLVLTIQNNPKDYTRFYHTMGDGSKVRHDKVHNLYGYNMTRAAKEAFDLIEPNKRTLIFSRASYVGMHRYGGIWTGDNQSIWSHLLLNLKMMPSLNMCGFLFTGADIGGFGGNTTEDLLLRWLALGIFTPLMRNHSAIGTRRQEAYQFEQVEAIRNLLGIRYGLIPYLYSEFMKAAIKDEMMFLPLGFEYEDDAMAAQVEDQLLVGESIMIAPVYQQNATGRYVYLPEGMRMLRMKSLDKIESVELQAGHHYIEVALDEVILFIRPGKILPMATGAQRIDQVDDTMLSLYCYGENRSSYEFYQDDGFTTDITLEGRTSTITVEKGIVNSDRNSSYTIA